MTTSASTSAALRHARARSWLVVALLVTGALRGRAASWGQGSTCILLHCGSELHVCVKGPVNVENNCTSDAQCSGGDVCGAQGNACGTTSGCSTPCPE